MATSLAASAGNSGDVKRTIIQSMTLSGRDVAGAALTAPSGQGGPSEGKGYMREARKEVLAIHAFYSFNRTAVPWEGLRAMDRREALEWGQERNPTTYVFLLFSGHPPMTILNYTTARGERQVFFSISWKKHRGASPRRKFLLKRPFFEAFPEIASTGAPAW